MCLIILIFCVLIPFIRANDDETAAVVDAKYGQDMYCHFAYFNAADPNIMKECNSALAEEFGSGIAKGYAIGFTTYPDGTVVPTVVQDSNGVVCGTAYLLPVSEFQKIVKKTTTPDNQRLAKLITLSVDVTKDGQQIPMKCNTFQELTKPKGDEVPCEDTLDSAIAAYTAGHLSQHCITKLQQIPTTECECTPP